MSNEKSAPATSSPPLTEPEIIGQCMQVLDALDQHERLRVLVYLLDRELRGVADVDGLWIALGALKNGVAKAIEAWGYALQEWRVRPMTPAEARHG